MIQVFYIVLAILSGAGIAMQASMLGAIGSPRTPAAISSAPTIFV